MLVIHEKDWALVKSSDRVVVDSKPLSEDGHTGKCVMCGDVAQQGKVACLDCEQFAIESVRPVSRETIV